MIMIAQALRELAPDATWSIIEDDLDNIIWHSTDIPQPSKAEIDAKIVELQAAEAAKKQAQEAAKASALTKLAALGLTADEIKVLTGA